MISGWVGLVDNPAKKSSTIVQLLESMGAVLYVKTNVPQSLMVCLNMPSARERHIQYQMANQL